MFVLALWKDDQNTLASPFHWPVNSTGTLVYCVNIDNLWYLARYLTMLAVTTLLGHALECGQGVSGVSMVSGVL